MPIAEQALAIARNDVAARLTTYWFALKSDYKSLLFAVMILGLVIGFGIRIPW